MYSFAIYLYMCAIGIAAIFNKRARMLAIGHRKAFVMLKRQVQPGQRYVWFHAASLGEFEQGRPLMERLRRECPQYKILLTFFSPSGYEVRKNYQGADVICYLPLDTPTNVRLFFHYVKPEMAFFIKYEFWQNFMKGCKKRGIPVYSVSSIFRPNQIFFRWYGRHGYAKVLDKVTWFFVQNEQSRQLLATLGHTNVSIVGDTRFDRVIDIRNAARPLPVVEHFVAGVPQVFVAGSSWPPDEALFIPWFNRQAKGASKLIIAPHIISESHLADIESRLSRPFLRLSQATKQNVAQADVLIIDGFGLLSSIYRYATVAMIGGGFGAGIHNIAEAAVYGIPTIIGPNNANFREARYLLEAGGTFEVTAEPDFLSTVQSLLTDAEALKRAGQAAAHYIHSNAGATDKIFDHVFHNGHKQHQ
ncbi:MAG: 3-deoxy-D-manno-octulosonic acid transferase [Bacteroidaceae bacterium]|nr:3-deoxy-D-manno-octulosonic acid transferase [Bacteroidaceae bacterium]